jgi:molybdopterin-guanine dinucleotide biosynthesis protein A
MRLGGRDKALCLIGTNTLLAQCLTRLTPQSAPVALSANGDLDRFSMFDLTVVADSVAGAAGPLAGILAAMDWAADLGCEDVITVAVDTPFFPADLAATLAAQRRPNQIALAASRDATGQLRHHPTFGIWPTGARDQLRTDLLAGARKVSKWAEAQGATLVAFDAGDVDPFFNINTPEDLEQAAVIIRA